MIARLGRILLDSRANGPGIRDVFWFAGCSIHCPGCTNPHLLPATAGIDVEVTSLLDLLRERAPDVEGITLSGGEPTEQPEVALALATAARSLGLGVVMFSGRTAATLSRPPLRALRDACDLVVAGPYVAARPSTAPLLGSTNQALIWITDRYAPADLATVPRLEWRLGVGGVLETGIG